MKVGLKPPLFGSLLKARVDALQATGSAAKVRVLSLCSGGARTELGLVKDLPPERVSVTLFDVNRNLLNVAERTFSSWGPVQTIVGDVNEIDLRGEQFDVVLCVAALHHVVELEHVIESVAEAIGDTGEFWSMAEALGRNGGRMWPESYAVANEYFSRLPEKYRFNRNTSSVDHVLQNIDYSIGCFEGIRCEAIEPTLLKYLDPVHVSKHNCIVWKLFSLAYTDNYDVASEADRKLIETAVDLDAGLHRQGRFGVELHGVYRRKR
jgi:SAM-dependent methyltransferase